LIQSFLNQIIFIIL